MRASDGMPGSFFTDTPKVTGTAIPKAPGEHIEAMTFGFGSGRLGYRSVRIDRAGELTVVDRGGENEWQWYKRQRYRVPPQQAATLLDGKKLERCMGLRPYYAAVDMHDGGQDFLRIDSNQRVRTF